MAIRLVPTSKSLHCLPGTSLLILPAIKDTALLFSLSVVSWTLPALLQALPSVQMSLLLLSLQRSLQSPPLNRHRLILLWILQLRLPLSQHNHLRSDCWIVPTLFKSLTKPIASELVGLQPNGTPVFHCPNQAAQCTIPRVHYIETLSHPHSRTCSQIHTAGCHRCVLGCPLGFLMPYLNGFIISLGITPQRSRTSPCLRRLTALYAVLHGVSPLHGGDDKSTIRTSTQGTYTLICRRPTSVVTVALALSCW